GSLSFDGLVRVWKVDDDQAPLLFEHSHAVNDARFSPDGRRIVTASHYSVLVWDADGAGPPLVLAGHSRIVQRVAFSPDGRRIASGGRDRTVRIWNADGTGPPLVLTGHTDIITEVAFSPGGRRVASSSYD